MLDDKRLMAVPGQVILEPQRAKISAVIEGESREPLPPSAIGTIIKVGQRCPTGMKPGLRVLFVPHGGTLLNVGDDQPERMALPADQIIGTVED